MSDKQHKPDCYECKHRGEVPGSCHSSCHHPSIGQIDPLIALLGMFPASRRGMLSPMPNRINVKAVEHGIRNGWFAWPMNFDPTWLESCDGFEAKEIPPDQKASAQ